MNTWFDSISPRFFSKYPGKRVFDVLIENQRRLDNYDIVAEVGAFRGVVEEIQVTSDEILDIDFSPLIENPKVNGIEIIRLEAPTNDNFADAVTITPGQLIGVNIAKATREENEPFHGEFLNQATVWYEWTAVENGNVSISTAGSDFATVIAAYTGTSLDELTEVASDDATQMLTFPAQAGITYRIALAGFGQETGNADLGFTFTPTASTPSEKPDITSPGDAAFLVSGANDSDADSGSPPANEGVSNAIDNTTDKYLNFKDFDSGLIVTPTAGATIVTGLRLYTANDIPERDPASFLLEGSNNGANGPFTPIRQSFLSLPVERNPVGIAIDGTQWHQEVSFENETSYTTYRLTFPTLVDSDAANSMQIGEVEFLGTVAPTEPTDALYAINAGGPVLDDSRWAQDTDASPSPNRTGGSIFPTTNTIDLSHPSIPVGTTMDLFQTARYDSMQWEFPVAPGDYEVRLYFAEVNPVFRGAFDVTIEGQTVLDDYSVFDDVGANRGVVKTFTKSSDGTLDIDFSFVTALPLINGIEILPTEVTASLPGDIDGDGTVQFSDFVILANTFGQNVPPGSGADLDGDGAVQFSDFVILADNFGRTAALSAPSPAHRVVDSVFATLESSASDHDDDWIVVDEFESSSS